MDLSIELKREIADQIIRVIAPVLFFSMIFTVIGVFLVSDHQYQRLIGAVVAIALIIPSWVLAQKKRPMTGIIFLLASFCLAIIAGMVASGGVHALSYTAALTGITVFTLLYGISGGIIFAISTIALGGLSILLIKYGILHRVNEPTAAFLYLFHAILLFMQFFFVLIPVRLMYKALTDTQQQSAELRQAMIERKQAQAELQSILDKTPDIIYRLDPEGRITFVNEAIRKYGPSPEDLIGKPVQQLIHPDDWTSEHRRLLERRTGPRSATGIEIRLSFPAAQADPSSPPGAEKTWLLFHITNGGLYSDEKPSAESFVGVQGIARDISRIKHFEQQFNRLATVVEQAAEDVVITDKEGFIQYVNPRFEEVTGYSLPEVVGLTPRIFKSGKHDDAFYADLWKTITSGKIWKGRLWNKIKSGKFILQDVTITPIFDAAGKLTGYASVRRDITEQDRLQEQLQQAQKMEAIGTLAGGIAHDFNNILSGIIGYTELALAEINDQPSPRGMLGHVLEAAGRATDLVRQILSFSRSQKGEVRPVKPVTIIKEVLKLMRASLPATISIKQSLNSDSYIESDPTNIHQVLMNLCTNAAQAMKEKGGVLSVSLEDVTLSQDDLTYHPDTLPGAYLKISVEDTGIGIPPEIQPKIFDPFFTTKGQGEGTGMGLSTVHGIIAQLSGFITLYSEHGQGTVMHVFIPLIPNPKPAQFEHHAANEPIQGGTERILFVDDEQIQIELAQKALSRHGYQVTGFTDSTVALIHFQQNPDAYDLIITDMTMPKMTGDMLTQKIHLKRPDIPVIMCTGFSEVMDERKAKALDIDAFLYKPIVISNLLMSIRNVLDLKMSSGSAMGNGNGNEDHVSSIIL